VIKEGSMKLRFWRHEAAETASDPKADAAVRAMVELAAARRQTESLAKHEGSTTTFEEQFRSGPGQYGGTLGPGA
jgi:hypothetical protein